MSTHFFAALSIPYYSVKPSKKSDESDHEQLLYFCIIMRSRFLLFEVLTYWTLVLCYLSIIFTVTTYGKEWQEL